MKIKTEWNKISVQWRWRLFFLGFAVLFLVSYEFNIKKTYNLIADYDDLKKAADTIPKDFNGKYSPFIKIYSHDIDQKKIAPTDDFLKNFAMCCDSFNVEINEIAQSYSNRDSLTVETDKIIISGGYEDILKLIFFVENQRKIAAFNSASWELIRDGVSKDYSLNSTLYVKKLIYEKK